MAFFLVRVSSKEHLLAKKDLLPLKWNHLCRKHANFCGITSIVALRRFFPPKKWTLCEECFVPHWNNPNRWMKTCKCRPYYGVAHFFLGNIHFLTRNNMHQRRKSVLCETVLKGLRKIPLFRNPEILENIFSLMSILSAILKPTKNPF